MGKRRKGEGEREKGKGSKGAREQGSKGAREQGSKGAREQGSKGKEGILDKAIVYLKCFARKIRIGL
jgi:hypothetical protein